MKELMKKLREAEIYIKLEGGDIVLNFANDIKISDELIHQVKSNKAAIISFLKNSSIAKSEIIDFPENNVNVYLLASHIYLDTDDPVVANNIYNAFKNLLELNQFRIISEEDPILGSWWRRFLTSVNIYLTSGEVREKLEDIEDALKKAHIDKVQSEIDKNQAEAVAKLIESTKAVPNAILQVGSLIYVKYTDPKTNTAIDMVRTLTRKEMKEVNKSPEFLNHPLKMLELLKSFQLQTQIEPKG